MTERAATHLRREYLEEGQAPTFSVVRCCADFGIFDLPSEAKATRAELGIPDDATVLLYLGSIGLDYLLDQMMQLFVQLRSLRPNAIFLFVINNAEDVVRAAAAAAGLPLDALRIVGATRSTVPALIGASNLSVAFIRSDLSKLGCSPTKVAETLACGVPVIANTGVGDMDALLSPALNGSVTLANFTPDALRIGLEQVLARPLSPRQIRASALPLSLQNGVATYAAAYDRLGIRPS